MHTIPFHLTRRGGQQPHLWAGEAGKSNKDQRTVRGGKQEDMVGDNMQFLDKCAEKKKTEWSESGAFQEGARCAEPFQTTKYGRIGVCWSLQWPEVIHSFGPAWSMIQVQVCCAENSATPNTLSIPLLYFLHHWTLKPPQTNTHTYTHLFPEMNYTAPNKHTFTFIYRINWLNRQKGYTNFFLNTPHWHTDLHLLFC